jgi:peptidyl-tRNA hydrolase
MKDYRLYILMRNDLPSMNVGRAMAQASHASNAFIHEYGHLKEVKSWQNQTTQGFGTAIVLSANKDEIRECLSQAHERKLPHRTVLDPEWKFEVSKEVYELINLNALIPDGSVQPNPIQAKDPNYVILTKHEWACAYIFGEYEQTYWVLGRLPLHP